MPRSHVGVRGHSGFARLSAAEAAAASERRQRLEVPPGHLLVFNEKLMHEVCPAAPATPSHTILRLFTGWRLTTSDAPQHGAAALEAALTRQAVMVLKSGQTPKMYANMSWSQPKQRAVLEAWSLTTFLPRCHTRRAVLKKSGGGPDAAAAAAPAASSEAAAQEVRTMVEQQMRSLQEYDLALYPAYSPEERRMHYPGRSWTMAVGSAEHPGERREVVQLDL